MHLGGTNLTLSTRPKKKEKIMMIKINPSRGLSKWKHLFMPSMFLAFKDVVWKKEKDIAWFLSLHLAHTSYLRWWSTDESDLFHCWRTIWRSSYSCRPALCFVCHLQLLQRQFWQNLVYASWAATKSKLQSENGLPRGGMWMSVVFWKLD